MNDDQMKVQDTQDKPSPEEGSDEGMPQGADTPEVSSEKVVPARDLDALRSVKDREIAAVKKQLAELKERLQKAETERAILEERARTAEAMASEAQRQVALRQSVKAAATRIAMSYGPEIGRTAEEMLMQAESPDHLSALLYEFYNDKLPELIGLSTQKKEREERRQQAMSTTVGVTSGALPPTSPSLPAASGDVLDSVKKDVARARRERLWKDSPEGIAALRKARDVCISLGYPSKYLPRNCSWAQIANAISTLEDLGKGTRGGATSKV